MNDRVMAATVLPFHWSLMTCARAQREVAQAPASRNFQDQLRCLPSLQETAKAGHVQHSTPTHRSRREGCSGTAAALLMPKASEPTVVQKFWHLPMSLGLFTFVGGSSDSSSSSSTDNIMLRDVVSSST